LLARHLDVRIQAKGTATLSSSVQQVLGHRPKTLRVAFPVAESGFDPAQVSDRYSDSVMSHIFESLYQFDPLARPVRVRPLTAKGMPEHNADFTDWTVKIRPGIHFADDPAFKGVPRELTAADFVYSFKRFADPALKSPGWPTLEAYGVLGLSALREAALTQRRPFDYDRPIEGLQAPDRYTLRIRLAAPRPRLLTAILPIGGRYVAVAREVVEAQGPGITGHPVGTGPFRLVQWRRSSFIALERNPGYREVLYDADPAPDDAEGQALLKRLKGRRLPMVDRVEISVIETEQPRWLSFLQGGIDVLEGVPSTYINQAMPGGRIAPYLARRGVAAERLVEPSTSYVVFNLDDPVVGGYEAPKVALRRAIALAVDVPTFIDRIAAGHAIAAQSPTPPHTYAYDAGYRSENGQYDLPRAKALLDLFGYVDRNGDGWREAPDGQPLVLIMNTQPEGTSRQQDELWRRDMSALGLRTEFLTAKWQENGKAARAGRFMLWRVGGAAAEPDSMPSIQRYHSRQIGGTNLARVRLPALDALYERLLLLPDGPERQATFREMKRLTVVYMPYKAVYHRIASDLIQPWVVGYRRPLFRADWWQYVDLQR
jgi:ABC-type transport system substrate-binding protein